MSGGHVERERKFAARDGFQLPDLDGVVEGARAVNQPDQRLDATYYDTPDLRLARNGVSVRFRTGEGPARWTVKLPSNGAGKGELVRREIDVEAPKQKMPEEVAGLVRAHARSSVLSPVGRLKTIRHRVEVRDRGGKALVEVADDEVSVLEGNRVAVRFREVEAELLDGADPAVLEDVSARLDEAGAGPSDQTPKIVRALGPRAVAPPDVVVADLRREATVGDVVQRAIAVGFVRLVEHDPGVRLGGDDEDVHQARVATRRLRSDLRTFRDHLQPQPVEALRGELQWLGEELGHVRDDDVLHDRLRRQADRLPALDGAAAGALLDRLRDDASKRRAELRAALDSDRYLHLLDALASAAQQPPFEGHVDVRARKALPTLVRRPWRHLQRAVSSLPDHPADEDLHEVRIRAKRTRYAAEAAAPVIGKPAARFAKAVAALQGVLGDLQDAVVAESWLRAAATESSAPQAFVAGQLLCFQREAMAAARRDWPAAWAALDHRSLRSWFS